MDSGQELNKGYANLSLILRPDMRKYRLLDHVLEFKYLKLDAVKMSGQQVKETPRETLAQLPAVQQAVNEATQQLAHYRHALTARYQVDLRLPTFAVVALGFERLVFVETTVE